ncbi:MAG: hypothetical protein ABIK28_13600 [Planctomycetota bacterium]
MVYCGYMGDTERLCYSAAISAEKTTMIAEGSPWTASVIVISLAIVEADTLSAGAGGVFNFLHVSSTENAGRNDPLVGRLSGTAPGVTLPGGKILPVTWDAFSDLGFSARASPNCP